ELFVRELDREPLAEGLELVLVQLLLLVRDVLAFTSFPEAVALHRAREDDCRLTFVRHGRRVCRVHLHRIVATQTQLTDLIVAEVLDELEQARVATEKVLADVGARLDGVLLVLAVHDFAETLDEDALGVTLEQRIPVAAPDALDDVPAGAA